MGCDSPTPVPVNGDVCVRDVFLTSGAPSFSASGPAVAYDPATGSLWLADGTGWVELSTGGGTAGWSLTGNAGTTPEPGGTNYVGTSDAAAFAVAVDGVRRAVFDTDGVSFHPDGGTVRARIDGTETEIAYVDAGGRVVRSYIGLNGFGAGLSQAGMYASDGAVLAGVGAAAGAGYTSGGISVIEAGTVTASIGAAHVAGVMRSASVTGLSPDDGVDRGFTVRRPDAGSVADVVVTTGEWQSNLIDDVAPGMVLALHSSGTARWGDPGDVIPPPHTETFTSDGSAYPVSHLLNVPNTAIGYVVGVDVYAAGAPVIPTGINFDSSNVVSVTVPAGTYNVVVHRLYG